MSNWTQTYLDMHGNILAKDDECIPSEHIPSIFAQVYTGCVRHSQDAPLDWETFTAIRAGDASNEPGYIFLTDNPYGCVNAHKEVAFMRHEKIVSLVRDKLSKREPLIIKEVELPGD